MTKIPPRKSVYEIKHKMEKSGVKITLCARPKKLSAN
jgi:predicted peroxiredoxin